MDRFLKDYMCVYIYICVCMCACVCRGPCRWAQAYYIYINEFNFIYKCVCLGGVEKLHI